MYAGVPRAMPRTGPMLASPPSVSVKRGPSGPSSRNQFPGVTS